MNVRINKKNILNNIGIEFTNNNDYLLYMQQLIDYLESNNKNYTKRQYFKILELKEILVNMEALKNG